MGTRNVTNQLIIKYLLEMGYKPKGISTDGIGFIHGHLYHAMNGHYAGEISQSRKNKIWHMFYEIKKEELRRENES